MAFKNRFLIYRKFFIASLVIYILSFISGALISNFLNFDLLPHAEAFDDLLYHNLILGLKLMVFGWISLGVLNTICLGYNGIFLGTLTFSIVKHHGFTPILTGILPHGIIEIFAFLLFSTIGFESLRYVDFLKKKAKHDNKITYQKSIKNSIFVIILAVILLLIAAWIETYISHI
ncbi:stage II sporulation protein M [Bacillus thuringiensis]|uniref:Stage II sporulation protein M n=1 Tax=Bacillus thuringiensis TaxID=1428 RepID=A0AAW9GU97_BACTU|nr:MULTISPECIES: stage II sporulation protein M [Bacillus cereus group]MDY0854962.1 stage II sporulation protein M [Bacillus thuringiensis]MDY4394754.1 stage II sporulation protein M [Bacillus thuringiensis]QDD87392.1 hypothetical protein FORC087_609 [Bacillus cereus]GIX59946.1 membrane protein [Bacillus paranthracis]